MSEDTHKAYHTQAANIKKILGIGPDELTELNKDIESLIPEDCDQLTSIVSFLPEEKIKDLVRVAEQTKDDRKIKFARTALRLKQLYNKLNPKNKP